MKALVAEDDYLIQQLLINFLYDYGFQYVDSVTNGRALYCLGSISYDLIMTDIVMPDMDGISGLELARAFGNQSPVIIMTGDNTIQDGEFSILRKPFNLKELEDMILNVLGEIKN